MYVFLLRQDALEAFFAPTRNVLPIQSPQNPIRFLRGDDDEESGAESATESATSFDGVLPARDPRSLPPDANDHTNPTVEKPLTLANMNKQDNFPAHSQATRDTTSDDDHAAVPSKRKRNPVSDPEILPNTSASSPSPYDRTNQHLNREPQTNQRAQFRRAIERFVSVQKESRHFSQDEEQDIEHDEEHDEEQEQQNYHDDCSSVNRRHERRTTSLRPQAPIQDVTYAESDAEKTPEEHALSDTDIPSTQAHLERIHKTRDTWSGPSKSQLTDQSDTSQWLADKDDIRANDKVDDGNGVDAPTHESPVENLELGSTTSASIPEQDSSIKHQFHAGNNRTKDNSRINIDLDALQARVLTTPSSWSGANMPTSPPTSDQNAINSASFQEEDASRALHALERVMQKSDFANMRIVGQFNLGFIITRRTILSANGQVAMDDLFIIDQHAADEKFNFETLQRDTQIHSQALLHPQNLELAPNDELVAASHADCLKKNGFEIQVDEDRPPGRRIGLRSKPMSKNVIFDVHDFEELLFKLREASDPTRIRCTKVRDMFASRACRKSIMVGSALNSHQMRRVVNHMGELEQPWNCPHGRPTMRHLTSLSRNSSAPWHPPQVDWSKLCHRYPS